MAFWCGFGVDEDKGAFQNIYEYRQASPVGEHILQDSFLAHHVPYMLRLHSPRSWPGVGAFPVMLVSKASQPH